MSDRKLRKWAIAGCKSLEPSKWSVIGKSVKRAIEKKEAAIACYDKATIASPILHPQ